MLPDHRVRQREYLLEISRALTEELDLNMLLSRILHIAIEMLGGHAGFIALVGDSGEWHIAINQGIPPALLTYLENWLVSFSGSSYGFAFKRRSRREAEDSAAARRGEATKLDV